MIYTFHFYMKFRESQYKCHICIRRFKKPRRQIFAALSIKASLPIPELCVVFKKALIQRKR